MCTGRLDLSFVLRAFSRGVDGVFIAGCHLNECNYITHGNFRALGMTYLGRRLLRELGLDPERLRMELISGGEGTRFAELINDFSREARARGPLGAAEGMDAGTLETRLEAATRLVPYLRLVERERLRLQLKTEAEFESYFGGEEFERLFKELVGDKLAVSQILLLLREGALSTADIAKALGLTPSEVSRHMSTSSRHRLVRYDVERKCYALA